MDFSKQIAEDQRLLLADIHRRIEAALQPFADALDEFLAILFQARLPADWRQQWRSFVAEQANEGFFVKTESVVELEAWIEAWARFCGLLPKTGTLLGLNEPTHRQSVVADDAPLVGQAWGISNRAVEAQLAQLSTPADRQLPQEESKSRATSAAKRDKPGLSAKSGESEAPDVAPTIVTKTQLPAARRGIWVQGTPGQGAFRFNDLPENQRAGMAGEEVRFKNQCIAIGGFPPHKYYGGSAASATVEIDVVRGTEADATLSDARMRILRGDPTWKRPEGFIWNHAGETGSKIMELVDAKAHRATSHKGPAAAIRALTRIARSRGLGIINVYLVTRDVLQTAGVLQPDYSVAERETYHFVAEDGSVFVVWPAGWLSSARREFISGPRQSQKEDMTHAEVEECRDKAEAVWGKYIPGTLLSGPRFVPGTRRSTLPLIREFRGLPQEIGWIDEKGVHYYSVPKRIII